jgi:hypothetical protein
MLAHTHRGQHHVARCREHACGGERGGFLRGGTIKPSAGIRRVQREKQEVGADILLQERRVSSEAWAALTLGTAAVLNNFTERNIKSFYWQEEN